jgi:hypothetical protein
VFESLALLFQLQTLSVQVLDFLGQKRRLVLILVLILKIY